MSTKVAVSTPPACPHRPPCPGCPRYGVSALGTRAAAVLEALARDGGATIAPLVTGAPLGFRTRARLAVRGRLGTPKIGIFQAGSHRIADVPRCPIHHPRVNEVAAVVKRAMAALGVPPYADRPHRGLVRYLQIAVERASGRAQVVLVANDHAPAALVALASVLVDALGDGLHSLWWNGNPARTNAILGDAWHRWHGPEAIAEHLGGATVYFHPGAFCQSNGTVLDALVAAVHAHVPDGARVLELYAGAGTFGLGLLDRVALLWANEANAHALWGLARGLDACPPAGRARAVVLPGPAATYTRMVGDADVVIADPPRRGLDDAVREAIAAAPPARVVLVSCDVDALDRDARALCAAGLALRTLVPVDAFPYTEQVETVAVFDRP